MSDIQPGTAQPPTPAEAKHAQDKALARDYAAAASSDAHHERAGGGPGLGGNDPTLTTTDEVPDVPMREFNKTDTPIDVRGLGGAGDDSYDDLIQRGLEPGETSMGGQESVSAQALMRGLTPGEMTAGEEPEERTTIKDAPPAEGPRTGPTSATEPEDAGIKDRPPTEGPPTQSPPSHSAVTSGNVDAYGKEQSR